jgi:hypothetical protein
LRLIEVISFFIRYLYLYLLFGWHLWLIFGWLVGVSERKVPAESRLASLSELYVQFCRQELRPQLAESQPMVEVIDLD